MNLPDRWDAAVGEGEQQVPAGRRHVGRGGGARDELPAAAASDGELDVSRPGVGVVGDRRWPEQGHGDDLAPVRRGEGDGAAMAHGAGGGGDGRAGPREQVGRAEDFRIELVVEATGTAGTAATAGGEDAPVGNQYRHRVVAAVNPALCSLPRPLQAQRMHQATSSCRLKGAQTRSCSSPVLVEQTAEQVVSTQGASILPEDGRRAGGSGGCSPSARWGRWPL